MRLIAIGALFFVIAGGKLWAHASEQGFVLLLPTDIYITAGATAVALTVLMLMVMPDRILEGIYRPVLLIRWPSRKGFVVNLVSTLVLGWLIWRGVAGPRDPLLNPLPLSIWVVFWVALIVLQATIGNIWRWINPWTGVGAILHALTGRRAILRYPGALGYWPGVFGFLGFSGFLMADPAPSDPGRLAMVIAAYWGFVLGGLCLFGPVWLLRAEAVTILMRTYRFMGLVGSHHAHVALGLPGWKVMTRPRFPLGLAVFALLILGSGSFDGVRETFFWMGLLGLNPLEFPGRTAVVIPNLIGLLVVNAALIAIFALCLLLGERMAGGRASMADLICHYAFTILPIALAYHVAHYLTSFLVDGQYVLAVIGDALRLGHVHVTTGFLHTPGTVKLIWLGQACVVVVGHVIAIHLAHLKALRWTGDKRQALLVQAPLVIFMLAYTVFGLWLLASPRGA